MGGEQDRTFLQSKTFTIPAGGNILIPTAGNFFACTASSANFNVKFDDLNPVEWRTGLSLKRPYNRAIEITGTPSETLSIMYGFGEFFFSDAGTVTANITSLPLPAGGATSANQSSQIALATTLNALLTTLDAVADSINTNTSNIDDRLEGTDGVKELLARSSSAVGDSTVQHGATAALGTDYEPLPSQACDEVTIFNQAGGDILLRYVGSANDGVTLAVGDIVPFAVGSNANELEFKRVDDSTGAGVDLDFTYRSF